MSERLTTMKWRGRAFAAILGVSLLGCAGQDEVLLEAAPTSFQINITPGLSISDTKAEVVGAVPAPSSALDIYRWGAAVGLAAGYHDGSIYGQLPGIDLSKVTATVKSTNVTIRPPNIQPEALAHKLWCNIDNDQTGTYSASLTAGVISRSDVSWSRTSTHSFSATVTVNVDGGPVKASAATTYGFATAVGHSVTHSETHSINSTDGLSETLAPNSAALAILLIQSGTIELDIDFEVEFTGGPIPYWTQYFGKRIAGPTGTVELADALKHLDPYSLLKNTMHQSIDFFRDTESKIISIDSCSDQDQQKGIEKAKNEIRIKAGRLDPQQALEGAHGDNQ